MLHLDEDQMLQLSDDLLYTRKSSAAVKIRAGLEQSVHSVARMMRCSLPNVKPKRTMKDPLRPARNSPNGGPSSTERLKERNLRHLEEYLAKKRITIILSSVAKQILKHEMILETPEGLKEIRNDYVFIFAGGQMPFEFLKWFHFT